MFRNNTNNNIVDNINNCTVADIYIRDAIGDIAINGNQSLNSWWNSDHTLSYKDGPQNLPITKNNFFNISSDSIWKPIIVNANTNEQKISNIGIYNKATIGVNEYIKFNPYFKKYFRANNASVVIPWKLNSDEFPHTCTKGVLCWIISRLSNNSESNSVSWSNIPHYVPFYKNGGPYLKLDNERLLLPNNSTEQLAPSRGPFLENNFITTVPSGIFGSDYENITYSLNADFDSNNNDINLWIPEGDVYSYIENTGGYDTDEKTYISAPLYQYYTAIYHAVTIRRKRSFSRDLNQSRKYKNLAKYLASSPFITKFCIQSLTKGDIQNIINEYINGSIDLYTTLINISTKFNDDSIINSSDYNLQQSQSNNLIKTTSDLFNKLKNKYGMRLAITNGSIEYTEDLANKDDVAITNVYSINTKNANHYLGENSYVSLCQNINVNNYTIGSRINDETTVINPNDFDRSINILSKTETEGFVKTNFVPLYDSIEPKWTSELQLNIAMQFVDNLDNKGPNDIEWDPENILYKYGLVDKNNQPIPQPSINWIANKRLTDQGYVTFKILNNIFPDIIKEDPYFSINDEAKKQFSFLWEQVSGPPIKFTDTNISTDGLFDTSSSETVKVIFSDFARYTIRCSVWSPFGRFVKYKTFFVVNSNNKFNNYNINQYGNEEKILVTYTEDEGILNTYTPERRNYGGPILSEKLQQSIPIIPNRYNFKFVKTGGFKKIAINARGLVWFIDTTFKVARYGYLEKYIEKLSGPIYKILCVDQSHVSDPIPRLSDPFDIHHESVIKNRSLSLEYIISSSDSSATLYLDKIILENIRNGSEECAQCISTYGSDMIGTTTFGGVGRKTLAPNRINTSFTLSNLTDNDSDDTLNYSLPNYSLDYSSNLYKYGRYLNDDFMNAFIASNILSSSPLISTSSFGTNTVLGSILPDSPVVESQNSYYPSITGYDLAAERTNIYSEEDRPGTEVSPYKICYQKALDVIASGDIDRDFYINFTKGVFHPNSGWISGSGNTSYVLKFNPGARDSFAFKGPAIFGLTTNDISYDVSSSNLLNASIKQSLLPNIFSSSISVGIAKDVRWDPVCECPPPDSASDSDKEQFALKSPFRILQNQIHKEYADRPRYFNLTFSTGSKIDFSSWHGYRILGGGLPKLAEQTSNEIIDVNDEFVFNKNNLSYKNNTFQYEFAVTGPANNINAPDSALYDLLRSPDELPSNIREQNLNLRDPRVNNFEIKDIEVNLNFLNYVNTQDLIVWLEITPCASEIKRQKQSSENYPSPITAPSQFVNQTIPTTIQRKDNDITWSDSVINSNILLDTNYIANTGVGGYIKNLIDINSNNPGENFKIYLLNQEYIQNNKYNLSLKFSDHAGINHRTNDFTVNQNESCFGPYIVDTNVVIDNNDSISPTLAAMGYDDVDYHINSNILKKNYLYATNNTFSKVYGKPLFLNPGPEDESCPGRLPKQQGPSLDSKTTFTLKIAIVDEPEIMDNYDNLINAGILTNFIQEQNGTTASNMFNNLCNWEILLHTNSTKKPTPHSTDEHTYGTNDVLSLIKYHKSPNDNGYYGYNFIADLTDKKFLLPIANINAPHQYIQDFDLCTSAGYDISRGNLLLGPPSFPTAAIASILGGIAAAGVFLSGTGLAGASFIDGFIGNGYRDIVNYFQEAKRWENLDRRLGQIYNISHLSYPFGSPEKILLNLSKDGCFWYNVEAAIFRLSNTPILNQINFKPLPLYKINEQEPTNSTDKLIQLLSEFKYELINKLTDTIDSSFIKYNLSITCEQFQNSINTNVIQTSDINYNLTVGDIFNISIINVDSDGDGIVDSCEYDGSVITNNTYILKQTETGLEWSSAFADLLNNTNLITVNNMLSYHNWWNSEIIIKVNNPIVFDIFNINDKVEIFDNTNRTTQTHIFNVNGKAKILLDNQYYSILAISTESANIPPNPTTNENRTPLEFVKQNNLLRNDSNNTIAIINPIPDTSGNINSYPWSQWKFESDNKFFDETETFNNGFVPQISFSTNSRGSYGDVSPKIEKNYLHYIVHKNKIEKLYELFDNERKYKKIYNNIWYSNASTGIPQNISGPSQGYSYCLNDLISSKNIFNDDIISFIYSNISNTSDDSLSTDLQNNNIHKTLLINNKYEILYLNNNNFTTIYNDYTNSSSVSIEGIGILNNPIECDDIPIDRILTLQSGINNDLLSSYNGRINQASGFFQTYPSIATALAYYDSVSNNITSSSDIDSLYVIKNNIELLFEERNTLIKLQQKRNHSTISNIRYNILDSNNNVNKYHITKTVNDNYYWIHIDPKQSCFIAEELRPKVLKSTKYSCKHLDPNINIDSIDNNICPFSASRDVADGGDENIKPFDNMSFPGDPSLGITYGYYIPSGTITENKNMLEEKYSSIAGWKEESIYRIFYMNSTKDIVTINNNPDYVIYVEEIYDVAVPIEHTMTLQEALDQNLIKNDGSADVNRVSGWNESCGSSPGGIGLINTFGQRTLVPTRVCNIFNLDDVDSIKVKFRKIPRILRGVDFLGTIFRYGATSQYRQLNTGSPLQPIETTIGQGSLNNQLYMWQCLELDKDKQLVKTKLPDLMAIMNEMTFRAFYGSADGIENRNRSLMQNEYGHQLIPFEFFSKPPPEEEP